MVIYQKKIDLVEVVRKTKVETTYEHVSILGEVLGYWRRVESCKVGEEVQVHLNHTLREYDRLYINGEEIHLNPTHHE